MGKKKLATKVENAILVFGAGHMGAPGYRYCPVCSERILAERWADGEKIVHKSDCAFKNMTDQFLDAQSKPVEGEYRVAFGKNVVQELGPGGLKHIAVCLKPEEAVSLASLLNSQAKRIEENSDAWAADVWTIQELKAQLTTAQDRVEKYKDENWPQFFAEMDNFKSENERLKGALEFYENEDNWKRLYDGSGHITGFESVVDDFDVNDKGVYIPGKRARQALSGSDSKGDNSGGES